MSCEYSCEARVELISSLPAPRDGRGERAGVVVMHSVHTRPLVLAPHEALLRARAAISCHENDTQGATARKARRQKQQQQRQRAPRARHGGRP